MRKFIEDSVHSLRNLSKVYLRPINNKVGKNPNLLNRFDIRLQAFLCNMDKQFVNKQELNAVPSAVRVWLFNLKINAIQIIVTGLLQKKIRS